MVDKLDLVLHRIDDMKDSHARRLDSIDENLLNHMKRTELLENRVDKLEIPVKSLKWLKYVILYLAAVAGIILSILKLVEYIK